MYGFDQDYKEKHFSHEVQLNPLEIKVRTVLNKMLFVYSGFLGTHEILCTYKRVYSPWKPGYT